MSGQAIALLVVVGLCFVAAAVWVGYWWNRPVYPVARKRFEFRLGTWDLLVFSNEIDREDAVQISEAVDATIQAWISRFGEIKDGIDGRRMIVVRVETQEWFEARNKFNMAAFLSHVGFRWHGWFYPMLVIRADYMESVKRTGEPVIHEMIHALQQDERDDVDREHTDPEIWKAAGGKDSLQVQARSLYLDL